jgi:hypothetical protein
MKLNDRALLVSLGVSEWTAKKMDKRATKQVNDGNHASSKAGRYNKSLFPMNDLLENVHGKTRVIRAELAKNTLPWGIDGTRILPSKNYLTFMTQFRREKGEWQTLVNEFLDNYDVLVAESRRWLGNLYDPKDYPPIETVTKKFKMDMAVLPVPTNDFRVELADDEIARIQEDLEARMATVQQEAMSDCWHRLYKHVEHITERLADPKNIFRDSLLDNARETCDLLTRLNISDDANLEAMRSQVESKLLSHHPDVLRTDLDLRADTADEARKIMDAMGAFFSPTN